MDLTQALKLVIPVLMFGATVLREFLSKRTWLRIPYWGLMVMCVIAGVVAQIIELRESETRAQILEARNLANQNRQQFEDALAGRTSNLELAIESTFDGLQRAIELASRHAGRVDADLVRLQAQNDLAMANERLAYGSQRQACRYAVDASGQPAACRVDQGAQIFKEIPPELAAGMVHCTDLQDEARWRDAGRVYADLEKTLATMPLDNRDGSGREVVVASRNLGYYRLCALLRRGTGTAADAVRAWMITEKASERLFAYRHAEIQRKLKLLAALSAPGALPLQCSADCAR